MKKIILIIGAGLLLASCNKFSDINVNPNLPTQASNTQLIANAALYLPNLSSSPQGEYFAQYLSETQYPSLSLFTQVSASFYGIYQGPLMNLDTVLHSTTFNVMEGPVANQLAVAKILKAYYYWHITDRWGDVPYTEALRGKAKFTPQYDTQKVIYDSLFTLLDDATKMIVSGDIINDIVYQGKMDKWKKLANTVRLLMALRLSEKDAAKAQDQFNKALTGGIMTSNDDNLVFKHLAEAANENYWYDQIKDQNRKWWAISTTLMDKMKPVGDPRLPIYANKNSSGQYVGLEYGKPDGLSTTAFSLLGAAIWKQDAPIYLVTYAQALFAKAEAAKRGWIAGGDVEAETNYKLALEHSVRMWNNNDTTGLGVFRSYAGIAYAPATGLEQIATQRWVHLFMHGFEGWAEWRRTGFPTLLKPGGKEIPTRQGYPTDEPFKNKVNYQNAINSQFNGADDLYGKVWWDKP